VALEQSPHDGTYTVSKSWVFRYSLDGRECRLGLGSFDKLTLDRARLKAVLLQEQVERKEDPKVQRDREKVDRRKAKVKKTRRRQQLKPVRRRRIFHLRIRSANFRYSVGATRSVMDHSSDRNEESLL
jgi:Arm domain-containing DNA-binding protein